MMECDWSRYGGVLPVEVVEESLEDPFGLEFLPDAERFSKESRGFHLGRARSGMGVFAVYVATGKVWRIIAAREMSAEEAFFYEKKIKEAIW
ncbi:MAG: hypothetical protein NZM04_07100 [Methylacidiphilales bacterium]|nr:hypothetical protein [Candidatus Methylacidiphilales bacterium]MDW8349266.1 hypothetical protein [Verrucomicrobiae bacterium]